MIDTEEIIERYRKDPSSVTQEEQMMVLFVAKLPKSLWMNHYELAKIFPDFPTPIEWRKFLKEHEQFITAETAMLAESAARKALNDLGTAKTQDVAAIRALLDKSKLINDSQKQQQHILISYIPPKKEEEPEERPW